MKSIFGSTIQLYTTPNCDMGCVHCNSKSLKMDNMTLETFNSVIQSIKRLGISRVELFANEPFLHPQIREQIEILNRSGLEYAILTVGDSPKKPYLDRFKEIALTMNREKGGLVFSVDYPYESAKFITQSDKSDQYSYGFKAKTFWELIPFLKENGFKVRVNSVITNRNYFDIPQILSTCLDLGFAVSFCTVQMCSGSMKKVFRGEIDQNVKTQFRDFLYQIPKIEEKTVNWIIKVVNSFGLVNFFEKVHTYFNCFRGFDGSETNIPIGYLKLLQIAFMELKTKYPQQFLPNIDFIQKIGESPSGCLNLIQQGNFPQLKINTNGYLFFCCDLHDPNTQQFHISEFPYRENEFLDSVYQNPYILTCAFFNPCEFSINYVKYQTVKKEEKSNEIRLLTPKNEDG